MAASGAMRVGTLIAVVALTACGPEFAPDAHLPDGQLLTEDDAGTVLDYDGGQQDAGRPDAGHRDAGFDGGFGYSLYVSGCMGCAGYPQKCWNTVGHCEERSTAYKAFCAIDCETDEDCPADAYCDDLNAYQGKVCYPKNTAQCVSK